MRVLIGHRGRGRHFVCMDGRIGVFGSLARHPRDRAKEVESMLRKTLLALALCAAGTFLYPGEAQAQRFGRGGLGLGMGYGGFGYGGMGYGRGLGYGFGPSYGGYGLGYSSYYNPYGYGLGYGYSPGLGTSCVGCGLREPLQDRTSAGKRSRYR